MHVGFFIGLLFAFIVLQLLSFLRNGAILRGGAVAAAYGKRGGEKGASATALQSAKRPCLFNAVRPVIDAVESPELNHTQNGSGCFSLAETDASLHSQSSQVFLQARRSAQLLKRKVQLIQQRNGDTAEVAAAQGEDVTASNGSDVASAWAQKQLCADDHIRLVFLFTFAVPVFSFWCWQLRSVRLPYLLDLYCYLRGTRPDDTNAQLQAVLCAIPIVVSVVTWLAVLLYYAFFIYLDHRDKDVSLKRHNNTRRNRLVNWIKFCIYRPYVNFKCYLWKRYFSLQLVPAYGPLPLFLFPDRQEEALLHESSSSKTAVGASSSSSGGGGTSSRQFAAVTASARHSCFFVAVNANTAGDSSPLDTPLSSSSFIEAPPFLMTHIPSKTETVNRKQAEKEEGGKNDDVDWDEEERKLLRQRGDAGMTPPAQPPSTSGLVGLANHTGERSSAFSADSTRVLSSRSTPSPPPPMRRAHYFFAAHPHGILPWCCCVNLISNVTKRNTKLFVDNRHAVLHPTSSDDTSTSTTCKQEGNRDAVETVNIISSPKLISASKRNTFTTSNTRSMASPSDTRGALLFPTWTARESVGAAQTVDAALPSLSDPKQNNGHAASSPTTPATANHVNYAKGRYYVYHTSLKKFVLRLDKDEAVPASAADAAVYQKRLKAAAEKRAAKEKTSTTEGYPSPSFRHRLKIRIRAVVATFPFYVPIMREIYMFHGYMDASYETCKRVLLYNNSTQREREGRIRTPPKHEERSSMQSSSDQPSVFTSKLKDNTLDKKEEEEESDDDESTLPDDLNHLLLFPGGASEALLSSCHGPARVLLRRRKGFLRLALHTQSGLVPVYTFGETDYFDQFSTTNTRYAAPLDDDSTLFSVEESVPDEAGHHTKGRSEANYYRHVIPSCTDEEDETSIAGTRSPHSLLLDTSSTQVEAQQHSMRELEKRLLRDEEDARGREGRLPCSPAHMLPGGPDRSKRQLPSAEGSNPRTDESCATHASPRPGRLPRFVQAVQRLFQQTFGISLPVVRNIIPHRVTGATVVGRPIYFELPPELQRMYTDPANYYDREKERAVLLAAQEVYFNELQELFLKYAPRYLKDPSRRKLEIL